MSAQTIGILGDGQLGRMLAQAAKAAGVEAFVLGSPDSPTGQVCTAVSSPDELMTRSRNITLEFENVSVDLVRDLVARGAEVRPGERVLSVCQDRIAEKRAAASVGALTAHWRSADSTAEVEAARHELGGDVIVKTARNGYDGIGQWRVAVGAMLPTLSGGPWIVEERVPLQLEFSLLVARGADGSVVAYAPFENEHVDGILDVTMWPARLSREQLAQATSNATAIAESLALVGLLCVEFFLTDDGRVLVNEMAPRPHNSGHCTIEAAETSQFEQQLRVTLGRPLGVVRGRPAAMVNLLGDLWEHGEPNWDAVSSFPDTYLHLYGKSDARPRRKMGHLTVVGKVGDDVADLRLRALAARKALLT